MGRQRRGPTRRWDHERHPEAAARGCAAGQKDQQGGLRFRSHPGLVHQQAHQRWQTARTGTPSALRLPPLTLP